MANSLLHKRLKKIENEAKNSEKIMGGFKLFNYILEKAKAIDRGKPNSRTIITKLENLLENTREYHTTRELKELTEGLNNIDPEIIKKLKQLIEEG